MSNDSHAKGYDRGYADGLADSPRRQPGLLLELGDDGYCAYWQNYASGYAQGEIERRQREAMEAAV